MPAPHLTKTVITDKNGVLTTRWTKPAAPASSKRAIPLATVQEARTQDQIISDQINLRRAVSKSFPFNIFHGDSFFQYGDMNPKMSKAAAIDRYLTLPQRTRETIEAVGARENARSRTAMIFVKLIAREATEQWIDDTATYMAGTDDVNFEFLQSMFQIHSEVDLQYQPIQIDISGLKYYRLNGFSYNNAVPISDHDEHTQEQIAAIFKLHSLGHALVDQYGYERGNMQPVRVTVNNVIEPYWLAQYAVQNLDKVDLLIRTIEERGSADREMLMSVVGNEALSLNAGVL